jgi:hypothetical protein
MFERKKLINLMVYEISVENWNNIYSCLIIRSLDRKHFQTFFFFWFFILFRNHRVFVSVKAILWAPTDCDIQVEEVEISLALSLIAMMVRRLRARILIDCTGVCVGRERCLETTYTRTHPILVVATMSIPSSNERG